MPLVIGTHLGLYEVTAHIGAGGMGEVYQAQDTKLGRKVALKVLPEAFAQDADRTARLEREARVLASLNHPHIAALFGFEEAGPNQFLVMELVEGETLADRLQRGPMPVDEALKVGHQIVDALEAAHEKGIVHRDLKPANVKITPDDRVKVLDFGLARLQDEPGSDARPSLTNSPTLGLMATQAGVVLGTAAYMSPEQAKGLVADHRSDVFSFGVVLYEMLTGKQAFQAETAAEMMAAVLMREPDLTALPANLNLRILELLRRCVDKQPKRRWQAVGDLRAELETVMAAPLVAPAGAPTGVAPKVFWRRAIPFATTAILSAAIAGGWVWWKVGTTPTPPSVVRFPIVLGEGQFANTAFRTIGISPDGTQVVYAANASLYVRVLSEVAGRPLAGTEQNVAGEPTFSPDGQSIAYVQASDRTLRKIAVRGGAAITLAPIDAPYSLSWSQDGILFSQPTGIMRVPSTGGPAETLVNLKPGERAYGAQMLPDGDTVMFTMREVRADAGTRRRRSWPIAQVGHTANARPGRKRGALRAYGSPRVRARGCPPGPSIRSRATRSAWSPGPGHRRRRPKSVRFGTILGFRHGLSCLPSWRGLDFNRAGDGEPRVTRSEGHSGALEGAGGFL
jgi:serine/threonine-protein kinase